MIQVNSLVAVFMAEGLFGLLLLAIISFLLLQRRKKKERNAARKMIKNLKANEDSRSLQLAEHLSDSGRLGEEQIEQVLAEIDSQEKQLYQRIVKLFLNRDAALLSEIDQSVQALSEPFCNLLSELSVSADADPALNEAVEAAHAEIARLKTESQTLSEQLGMAMETMDEVSREYANIFGSSKNSEELDVSRKRMLNTYQRAAEKMNQAFIQQPAVELEIQEV